MGKYYSFQSSATKSNNPLIPQTENPHTINLNLQIYNIYF